jgi:hypothetical protein
LPHPQRRHQRRRSALAPAGYPCHHRSTEVSPVLQAPERFGPDQPRRGCNYVGS